MHSAGQLLFDRSRRDVARPRGLSTTQRQLVPGNEISHLILREFVPLVAKRFVKGPDHDVIGQPILTAQNGAPTAPQRNLANGDAALKIFPSSSGRSAAVIIF